MRTVGDKIKLKSGKLVDGFTDDECNIWLAAMGWVRDRERWYSPDGTIEILSYELSDEEMQNHPCVIVGKENE